MAFSKLQVSFLQTITHTQHTDTPTFPRPSSTHTTQTTADCFPPNHLATLHHFRFRSSDNPAFSCPPHFLVLSLIYWLSVSPIILHITHTLFCREVHSPSSRSRCCLASKRTQNLRAILLLNILLFWDKLITTACLGFGQLIMKWLDWIQFEINLFAYFQALEYFSIIIPLNKILYLVLTGVDDSNVSFSKWQGLVLEDLDEGPDFFRLVL